jgi:hypothetical protein
MPCSPADESQQQLARPRLADVPAPDPAPIYDAPGVRDLTAEMTRLRAYEAQMADAITAAAGVEPVGEINELAETRLEIATARAREYVYVQSRLQMSRPARSIATGRLPVVPVRRLCNGRRHRPPGPRARSSRQADDPDGEHHHRVEDQQDRLVAGAAGCGGRAS